MFMTEHMMSFWNDLKLDRDMDSKSIDGMNFNSSIKKCWPWLDNSDIIKLETISDNTTTFPNRLKSS